MNEYETCMMAKVNALKASGCTHALFGDIFLEDLKLYREQKLHAVEVGTVFPLWKQDTGELVKEFIGLGFKSIIVCVNEKFLDRTFCGRLIDESFLSDLPPGVDPCGENGEFHSFVFDAPIFKSRIQYKKGEIVRRTYSAPGSSETSYGFYFCDLLPA